MLIKELKNRLTAFEVRKKSKTEVKQTSVPTVRDGKITGCAVYLKYVVGLRRFVLICKSQVPIMAMDAGTWNIFPVSNLQEFNANSLDQLKVPCIWRGIGNTSENMKSCHQAFTLNLQQAQAKPNFPGRVVLDFSEKDLEVLTATLQSSFLHKLPKPAQSRSIFGGCVPEFVAGYHILSDLRRPVLFGNFPNFEATTYEKRHLGSIRHQFIGERTIVAAPWPAVLKEYYSASGFSETNVEPVDAVKVKSWFRNLTEDLAPSE